MNEKILTGLRANGELHLGNYLGSMLPMAQLQANLNEGDELYMFVADLHSFTAEIDHSELYQNVLRNIRMYVAAGVDPEHASTLLYRQSHVPAHSQLAWILNCFTYFGEASRMTEFKDKSAKLGHENQSVTVGLFDYPVLMAADILLYGPHYVPLGDDQKQHMELARTLAERFNNRFGEVLEIPKSWKDQVAFQNRSESVRIRSLSNPSAKMSKSISDPKGTIGLLDDPADAGKKIMSAETDSHGEVQYDLEERPGISNLLQISAYVQSVPLQQVVDQWQGNERYGDLKKAVAEQVETFLRDFQSRYESFTDEQAEAALAQGEARANQEADQTLLRVQQVLGLKK